MRHPTPCVELSPDIVEMNKDLRAAVVAGVYDANVSLSLHCARFLDPPGFVLSSDLGGLL